MTEPNGDTGGEPAPAPPIDAETERLLERIAEIARNVRATWFLLLGVLAFAGVTLLGVEDADFFAVGRQTALPLVGVEIPTRSFFWTAPFLVAALYGYFHFQLRQLWRALAPDAVRAEMGGRPLADVVHPGLITDWGLRQRPGRSGGRNAVGRPAPNPRRSPRTGAEPLPSRHPDRDPRPHAQHRPLARRV